MVFGWAQIILLVISLLLIVIVLLQESKDRIDNTLSGEKSELFKNQKQRGIELVFTYTTWVLGALFIVFSVVSVAL